MSSKYKWRKIALFHIGLIMSIIATFPLAPKVFIVCAFGFLSYLSYLLILWISDVITSWAWGERKKTMNLKFGWALCGSAFFFIMAFILSINMKNLYIASLLTGLVYFFSLHSTASKNKSGQ